MPSTFPQEMIDQIVADPALDTPTLAACARVSKAFTRQARLRLYTTISMDIPVQIDSASTRLLLTFAESSQLCALVRVMMVRITAQRSRLSRKASTLMDINLPNLQSLVFEGTTWPFWFSHDTTYHLCENLVAQPGIRHLEMSGISMVPTALLQSASRLTSMTITDCIIYPNRGASDTMPAVAPSIEKFVVRHTRMGPWVLFNLFGASTTLSETRLRVVEYGVGGPWESVEECQAFLTKFGSTITDLTIRMQDHVPLTELYPLDLCALSKLQRLTFDFDSFNGIGCVAQLLSTVSSKLAEVKIVTREGYAMGDIWGGVDSQLYETATFRLLEIHLGIPGFAVERDDRRLQEFFTSIAPGLIESCRFRLWAYRGDEEKEVAFES